MISRGSSAISRVLFRRFIDGQQMTRRANQSAILRGIRHGHGLMRLAQPESLGRLRDTRELPEQALMQRNLERFVSHSVSP